MGLRCPLFSLVYHHDAVVVPWSLGKGEWGVPPADEGSLHGLLNARTSSGPLLDRAASGRARGRLALVRVQDVLPRAANIG